MSDTLRAGPYMLAPDFFADTPDVFNLYRDLANSLYAVSFTNDIS